MSAANALRRLSSFVFIGVVVWGIFEAARAPVAVLVAAICLIVTGVPVCAYSLRAAERYKVVFDYEPTEFWGATRNGKQAREVLLAMTTVGLWCAFAGVGLFVVALLP